MGIGCDQFLSFVYISIYSLCFAFLPAILILGEVVKLGSIPLGQQTNNPSKDLVSVAVSLVRVAARIQ